MPGKKNQIHGFTEGLPDRQNSATPELARLNLGYIEVRHYRFATETYEWGPPVNTDDTVSALLYVLQEQHEAIVDLRARLDARFPVEEDL